MKVLLLGAGGNAGKNYIKSLKMYDPTIKVYGADYREWHSYDNGAENNFLLYRSDDKIESIKSIIDQYGIDFVHAQPDQEVKFLAENSEELPCTWRSEVIWGRFADKLACQKKWQEAGLGVDAVNFEGASQRDFDRLSRNGRERVWVRYAFGAGSKAALPVSTFTQARNWVSYWLEEHPKKFKRNGFMMYEFLPGREFAAQMFWTDGELFHAQARERMEYVFQDIMPSGQSSTPSVARTISDDRVYTAAIESVIAIDPYPHGIYGVDLKENASGDIIPMEVNYGRYFTTNDFFSRIGVNTPYQELRLFMGERMDRKINSVKNEYFWIRGLDQEPVLKELYVS